MPSTTIGTMIPRFVMIQSTLYRAVSVTLFSAQNVNGKDGEQSLPSHVPARRSLTVVPVFLFQGRSQCPVRHTLERKWISVFYIAVTTRVLRVILNRSSGLPAE